MLSIMQWFTILTGEKLCQEVHCVGDIMRPCWEIKRTPCIQNISYLLWPKDRTRSPSLKISITKWVNSCCMCPLEGKIANWRTQQLFNCCCVLTLVCSLHGDMWNIWAGKHVEISNLIKVNFSTEKKHKCTFSGPPPV